MFITLISYQEEIHDAEINSLLGNKAWVFFLEWNTISKQQKLDLDNTVFEPLPEFCLAHLL